MKLSTASEASVVFEYGRAIPLGSFREFIFWMPNEVEVPTMVAQCNFTEPNKTGKGFLNHFILFGMHDAELKFVRRWMLNQYVEEKQKAEG